MIPSPIVFTASNPDACAGHKVGSVLREFRTGPRPDWATTVNTFRVYQAEGQEQANLAAQVIAIDVEQGFKGTTTVVSNLGIDPAPFVKLGVSALFVECYAEAGVVQTSIPRMRWQARQDGWPKSVQLVPTLGVYDTWHLDLYVNFAGGGPDIPGNGGPAAFRCGHWRGGPLAIYLGEGMTDTGSWVTLESLSC